MKTLQKTLQPTWKLRKGGATKWADRPQRLAIIRHDSGHHDAITFETIDCGMMPGKYRLRGLSLVILGCQS